MNEVQVTNTPTRVHWRYALEGIAVAATIAGLFIYLKNHEIGGFVGQYRGEIALLVGFILATVLLRFNGQSWRDLGLTRPANLKQLPAQTGLVMFAGYVAAVVVAVVLVPLLGIESPTLERHSDVTGNILEYLIRISLISWGTAAFLEEMVGRGFLINRFSAALGDTRNAAIVAVLLQGLLFGLAHPSQGVGGMLQTGAIGIVFGALYIRFNRNLWPLILAHGIMDTLGFTAIFFGAIPT